MDARLDPTHQLELTRHAGQCGGCRSILARYARLHAILGCAFSVDSTPELDFDKSIGFAVKSNDFDLANVVSNTKTRPTPNIVPSWSNWSNLTYSTALIAAMLLLAVGIVLFLDQSNDRIPIARSISGDLDLSRPSIALPYIHGNSADELVGNAIRPVSSFRSIETCYEITAELPGIRPLQSSLSVAIDWLQKSFVGNWFSEQKPDESNSNFGAFRYEMACRTA
jgi:hypothetical protein